MVRLENNLMDKASYKWISDQQPKNVYCWFDEKAECVQWGLLKRTYSSKDATVTSHWVMLTVNGEITIEKPKHWAYVSSKQWSDYTETELNEIGNNVLKEAEEAMQKEVRGVVLTPKKLTIPFGSKMETTQAKPITEHEGKKYLRTIVDTTDPAKTCQIDVYAVIVAYQITCPAVAHALKKLLCAGQRGKGDVIADLTGAIAAINRAIQLQAAAVEQREPLVEIPANDNFLVEYRDVDSEKLLSAAAWEAEDCGLKTGDFVAINGKRWLIESITKPRPRSIIIYVSPENRPRHP